jgi:hypothetical protein
MFRVLTGFGIASRLEEAHLSVENKDPPCFLWLLPGLHWRAKAAQISVVK